MEKPQRAEAIIREQIAINGETPYMLTCLGDVTGDEEYYERAWRLSGRRFARAKRTLGRICYDRGHWQDAIGHLDAALTVQVLHSLHSAQPIQSSLLLYAAQSR